MSSEPPTALELHEPELDPPFEVVEPAELLSPLVLSSPHSGSIYPRRFLESSRLDAVALRRSEDAFVDELFGGILDVGAPLIRARFPRAYLDLNREPYELDPRMFEGRLPTFANTRSVRVAGGLGTIARVVGESQEIYAGRLSVTEVLARIERLYKPYHARLRGLLDRARARFGVAVLVDCHSMPSIPTALMGGGDKRIRTDFVLGDRYGTSSDLAFVDVVEQAMRRCDYVVQRNKPYAGGFITEHYGTPRSGFHALQIEVNRALYMDERLLLKHERFANVAADVARVMSTLFMKIGRGGGTPKRKEPLAIITSGPSLGRKRPRRASAATNRYRTAIECTCVAQKSRGRFHLLKTCDKSARQLCEKRMTWDGLRQAGAHGSA
jgi:N-formylglutamate amidohydrolase